MKRYRVTCDGLVEDPDGRLVLYIDVMAERIEIKKRHLALVTEYQKTLDAIKTELTKVQL